MPSLSIFAAIPTRTSMRDIFKLTTILNTKQVCSGTCTETSPQQYDACLRYIFRPLYASNKVRRSAHTNPPYAWSTRKQDELFPCRIQKTLLVINDVVMSPYVEIGYRIF